MKCIFILASVLLSVVADETIHTNNGFIQGITVFEEGRQVEAFLGIPYAEPPVGDLRFRKPVPKGAWDGVYQATSQPPPCMQSDHWKIYYFFPDRENMTENCLYLNVWVPKSTKSSELKSIVIWIHGGMYYIGSANIDAFDGSTLASRGDVIVANFNYRLGSFGLLTAFVEEAEGNMLFLDQLLAIRWIKDNAKHFGGDPDSITVIGHSVGAMALSAHLVSPLAKNLFKRAIMQSGSMIIPFLANNKQLLKTSQQLATLAGCANNTVTLNSDPTRVIECLKKVPAEKIVDTDVLVIEKYFVPFSIRIGDEYMPDEPLNLYRNGKFHDTEMLMGFNRDEGTLYLTAAVPQYVGSYGEAVDPNPKEIAKYFIGPVENGTPIDFFKAISEALEYYLSKCAMLFNADFVSLKNNPVYFYVFSHRSSISPLPAWMGVTHGEEIWYMLGAPIRKLKNFTNEEEDLSRKVMDRWAAFAKTGNPNIPGEITWPMYTYQNRTHINIDINENTGGSPDKNRCAIFRSRYQAQIDEAQIKKFKGNV